jgi:hypothetical protein
MEGGCTDIFFVSKTFFWLELKNTVSYKYKALYSLHNWVITKIFALDTELKNYIFLAGGGF